MCYVQCTTPTFPISSLCVPSPPPPLSSSSSLSCSSPPSSSSPLLPPPHLTVYDIVGLTSDRNCVVLNNVHIDIMDYIQPAMCTDAEFRKMWAEFEWENKVTERVHWLRPECMYRVCSNDPPLFHPSLLSPLLSSPLPSLPPSSPLPPFLFFLLLPSSFLPPSSSQITVNTNIPDLNEYLEHLLKSTNMRCLTPKQVLVALCVLLRYM